MITISSDTTPSAEYLHEQTCGLEEEGHEIHSDFVEVIEDVCDKCPIECDFIATGCPSCLPPIDANTAVIYYVAQSDATDRIAIKYDVKQADPPETLEEINEQDRNTVTQIADDQPTTFSVHDLGSLISETATEHNVKRSWTGNVDDSIYLGTDRGYVTFPSGVTVRSTKPYNDMEGETMTPAEKDMCPAGYSKVKWENDSIEITSSDNLEKIEDA